MIFYESFLVTSNWRKVISFSRNQKRYIQQQAMPSWQKAILLSGVSFFDYTLY